MLTKGWQSLGSYMYLAQKGFLKQLHVHDAAARQARKLAAIETNFITGKTQCQCPPRLTRPATKIPMVVILHQTQ